MLRLPALSRLVTAAGSYPLKHASSRALYEYWNCLRAGRAAPERGQLDPSAIRSILSDILMIEIGGPERFTVRLAGTRICSLMGRELKNRPFMEAFVPGDWPEMLRVLDEVAKTSTPMVGGLIGETTDKRLLELELLLLPLRHHGRTEARMLGSFAALTFPYWATLTPLVCLRIASSRVIEAIETLASGGPGTSDARLRAMRHLRVLRGGRA